MTARDVMQHPLPLIIALAGACNSGRKEIGRHLKRIHGFAPTAFAQPLYEGMQYLYGVSPAEILFGDPERAIERLRRPPRELLDKLRDHAKEVAGDDILIRRLVERTAARGEWSQQDLVITDLREADEIRWIRLMGGQVWWVRRPESVSSSTHTVVERLALEHFAPGDTAIINDGSLDHLRGQVDAALERARAAAAPAS